METHLYHTIFDGIEAKITDILAILINIIFIALICIAFAISRFYKWICTTNKSSSVFVGQLMHLGI